MKKILCLALVAGLSMANLLAQEVRVALVIGNGAYKNAPLKNPVNDATDMAAALKSTGFQVTLLTDADRTKMAKAVKEFGAGLKKDVVGLFFYAGHGVQIEGKNYLIPVDSDIEDAEDVQFKAIESGEVMARMQAAGNRANIMILDACRDNPFPAASRSVSRGLSVMSFQMPGALVVYSTSPGSVAADGEGRNGIFTKNLLKHIKTPGLDIELMFRKVRDGVVKETGSKQVPWANSSFGEPGFAFVPAVAVADPTPAIQPGTWTGAPLVLSVDHKREGLVRAWAREFSAARGIPVEVRVYDDAGSSLENSVAAWSKGQGPDIAEVLIDNLPSQIRSGQLLSINEIPGVNPSAFLDRLMNPVTEGGRAWAVPLETGNNLVLFLKQGASVPLDRLPQPDGPNGLAVGNYGPFMLLHWALGNQVDFLAQGQGQAWDSPAGVSALKALQTLSPLLRDPIKARDAFVAGRVGGFLGGTWDLDFIRQYKKDNFVVIPVPAFGLGVKPRVPVAGRYIVLPARLKQDAGRLKVIGDLLQYLLSDQNQVKAAGAGYLPVRKSMVELSRWVNDDRAEAQLRGEMEAILDGADFPVSSQLPAIWNDLLPLWDPFMFRGQSPAAAAKAVKAVVVKHMGGEKKLSLPAGAAPYLAIPERSAWLELTKENNEHGLSLGDTNNEYDAAFALTAGRPAWVLSGQNPASASVGPYWYFDVTDPEFIEGKAKRCQVVIEYFDDRGPLAQAEVRLEYDSFGAHKAASGLKEFQEVPEILQVGTSKTWKTFTFTLDDARFANFQKNSDFRLSVTKGLKLALASVSVVR